LPNSHYSVTKSTTSGLIYYTGKSLGVRCANLRLYSVYGPLEERSRLIPSMVVEGLKADTLHWWIPMFRVISSTSTTRAKLSWMRR